MGSSFGQLFRLHTWGESHGGAVGVVIDGCPPRVPLCAEQIQVELDRRRPGQSRLTTPRQEEDRAEILSGTFEGQTLGTPILVLVRNRDARPEAYAEQRQLRADAGPAPTPQPPPLERDVVARRSITCRGER